MKKLIYCLTLLFVCSMAIAQKAQPTALTQPNVAFLKTLAQNAKTFSAKAVKGLTANEKLFVNLVITANNATTWDKAKYKAFALKATPLITALGIGNPDDGGEIFIGDPDDGGEIFVSSKSMLMALNSIINKLN